VVNYWEYYTMADKIMLALGSELEFREFEK